MTPAKLSKVVVIVDPNNRRARGLVAALEAPKRVVRATDDPIRALGMMREILVDVLVAEMDMEFVNGYALITAARRQQANLKAFLTVGTPEDMQFAIGAGVDHFVRPYDLNSVKRAVARALREEI